MTSIIKVDQIQTAAGAAPTVTDLGVTVPSASVPTLSTGHMPTGSVLQVVNSYSTSQLELSSTTLVTLNTLSVTPVATGSRFAIQFFLYGNWGNTNHGFGAYMHRDGSEVARSGNSHSIYTNTLSDAYLGGAWSSIDETGSTAGTAISFQLKVIPYKSTQIRFSGGGQSRGFIITEIAG